MLHNTNTMIFKRDNTKNKKLYYRLWVLFELALLITGFYLGWPLILMLFLTPVILLDMWSNTRCANRQKKYIREVEITSTDVTCQLANGATERLPREKCLFSIRENKFEKEKTEIEIRKQRTLKSRLIGRLHIKNWQQIFEIRDEFVKQGYAQIKYRPEGYWSKYGTFTADVVITAMAADAGEHGLFMPLTHIKEDMKTATGDT